MNELSRQNQEYLVEEIISFCEKWGMWKDVSIHFKDLCYADRYYKDDEYKKVLEELKEKLKSRYHCYKSDIELNENCVFKMCYDSTLAEVFGMGVYELDWDDISFEGKLYIVRNTDVLEANGYEKEDYEVFLDETEFDSYEEYKEMLQEENEKAFLKFIGDVDLGLVSFEVTPVVDYIEYEFVKILERYGLWYEPENICEMTCYYTEDFDNEKVKPAEWVVTKFVPKISYKKKEELSKELFNDVVVFLESEPGAMGPSGTLEFLKKNGEHFYVDYIKGETPFSLIKELFPEGLDGAYFNGPKRNEPASSSTIIIGDSGHETTLPNGWNHIYLDFGNHLCVRSDVYRLVNKILKESGKDNCDKTFSWAKILESADFVSKIDNAIKEHKNSLPKKRYENPNELDAKLRELRSDPEFEKKFRNVEGFDEYAEVMQDFGVDIDGGELMLFLLEKAMSKDKAKFEE